MEKQEGYKKTKIGWMPEDWDVRAIGSFSKSSSLKNTASKVKNVVSVTKYDGIVNSLSYFKKQVYSQNIETYKIIKKDEFAYATIHLDEGSIGVLAHCEEAVLSPMYTVFSIDLNVADRDFFMGLVKSERMMNIYQHIGAGSINRRKSIPFSTFSKIQVPFPPLPEQKKIASILTTVDDKISSIEHQIQQTEQLKKGLMEKLLTEGIGHTEFKETKIGRIPKGWDIVQLIELSETGISNGVFNDPKKVGRGYRLINVVNLYSEPVIKIDNLTRLDLDDKEFNKFQVQKGDIFFTRSSLKLEGIAHCNIYDEDDEDIVYECHIMRIRPKEDIAVSHYLKAFFVSPSARKFFMARAKQVTMTTISQNDIYNMPVPLPSIEEQKQIATILSTVDDKIDILNQKKSQYQTLKKGLSQQLLTGQMRVKI